MKVRRSRQSVQHCGDLHGSTVKFNGTSNGLFRSQQSARQRTGNHEGIRMFECSGLVASQKWKGQYAKNFGIGPDDRGKYLYIAAAQ